MGLVLVHDRDRVGAVQLCHRIAHGIKQIAVVEAVHQMRDDLGIRLAGEHITPGLQHFAQFLVVLDDAVVYQRHPTGTLGLGGRGVGSVAEMGVCVVHGGCAVRGPAGVRNAGRALQMLCGDLLLQFCHARGAACAVQAAGGVVAETGFVHRHAAGVIATVLEALQALNQDGNNITLGNRADDAAHMQ